MHEMGGGMGDLTLFASVFNEFFLYKKAIIFFEK